MSVIQYWKERLFARDPFYSEAVRLPKINLKVRRPVTSDPWPHSIARFAMFQDYQFWHEDIFLKPYKNMPFYEDMEERLPKPVDELAFFTTMAPWIYIIGKKQQVRNYLVPQQRWYEGEWIQMKGYRYFVRLCEWEDHAAVFELLTGLRVTEDVAFFDIEKAKRVSETVSAYMDKIRENKSRMEQAMGT